MKVKVRDTIYSASEEPILLILTDKDKKNLASMDKSATKYCAYPKNFSSAAVKQWMRGIYSVNQISHQNMQENMAGFMRDLIGPERIDTFIESFLKGFVRELEDATLDDTPESIAETVVKRLSTDPNFYK